MELAYLEYLSAICPKLVRQYDDLRVRDIIGLLTFIDFFGAAKYGFDKLRCKFDASIFVIFSFGRIVISIFSIIVFSLFLW